MLLIIGYLIVFAVYFVSPVGAKLLIMAINFFIPDPLPYIDEIIMVLGLFANSD